MLVFHRSLKLHERTALDGGDPDIPSLFALRSSRGDAPAIDELGIAQLDRLVGWIDCAGDALAPSMAVVEVDSDVPGGLPVGADVGDGGKRGVAVGGAAGKPEDFVVKSAAAAIPEVFAGSEVEPVEIAAKIPGLVRFVDDLDEAVGGVHGVVEGQTGVNARGGQDLKEGVVLRVGGVFVPGSAPPSTAEPRHGGDFGETVAAFEGSSAG